MSEAIKTIDPRLQAPRVVPRVPVTGPARPGQPAAPTAAGSFSQVLDETLRKSDSAEVRFSAHALERLKERNIHLTGADMEQIREAVDRVAAKGSRESLLMKADLALVVNVPKRTVITAVPGQMMKEHVFTNIDSAVLLK